MLAPHDIFSVAHIPADDNFNANAAGEALADLAAMACREQDDIIFTGRTLGILRRGSPDQVMRAAHDVASAAIDKLGPKITVAHSTGAVLQVAVYASTIMMHSTHPSIRSSACLMRAIICTRLMNLYLPFQNNQIDQESLDEVKYNIEHFRAGAEIHFAALVEEVENPVNELCCLFIKTRSLDQFDDEGEVRVKQAASALGDLADEALRKFQAEAEAADTLSAVGNTSTSQTSIPLSAGAAKPTVKVRKIEVAGYEHLAHNQPHAGRVSGVAAALHQQMPWAQDLIRAIGAEMRGKAQFVLRPTLLIGPPGCGKSAAARIIAEAAGVHMETVTVAGASDNRDFSGTAAGYKSAHPSRVVDAIARSRSCNPLILIDEIEKESENRNNGKVSETLITMMEPETSRRYYDECLRATIDISNISWVLTANSLKGIPGPLISRLRIIQIDRPGPEYADMVIEVMREQVAQQMGGYRVDLDRRVMERLRKGFTGGADLRRVRAAIMAAAEIEIAGAVVH